jgi:universal stress protein A
MKVRMARRSRKVVLELEPKDSALPPVSLPELRLKQILVPVDFSECSRKALRYAALFAKQFNTEVLLLHVVEVVPMEGQAEVATEARDAVERKLFEWRKEFASPGSVQMVVREGIAAHQQIVEAASDCNSDWIIVGHHSRSGLPRMLLGSTAEKVVRHAPCPVLVIREREHDFISESDEATDLAELGGRANIRRVG